GEVLAPDSAVDRGQGGPVRPAQRPGRPQHQGSDQRQADLALPVGFEPVPKQAGLQAGELSNQARSLSSLSPPTAAMKASSTVSAPIRRHRPAGVSSSSSLP